MRSGYSPSNSTEVNRMNKSVFLHGSAIVAACILTGGEAIAGADDAPGYVALGAEDETSPSGMITPWTWETKCLPSKSSDASWSGYAPALFGIGLGERIDKPLYRRTFCRNLNFKGRPVLFNSDWRRASPEDPENPGQSYDAFFPFAPAAATLDALDANYFVTGIKVCTNGNKDGQKARIKGFELFGSKVDFRTAKVKTGSNDTTSIAKQLTNCKDWESRRNCPANEIAVGFKGYYSMEGMVSISLICRPLLWKEGRIRPLE